MPFSVVYIISFYTFSMTVLADTLTVCDSGG